jgi:hypothetical protein
MEVAVIILLLVVLSVGLVGIALFVIYRAQKRAKVETIKQVVNTNRTIVDRSRHKLANKQKILDYINRKGRASNAELRELIGVTDRTIVRYIDELEREGKIRQIGDTGRGVFYHRQKYQKHDSRLSCFYCGYKWILHLQTVVYDLRFFLTGRRRTLHQFLHALIADLLPDAAKLFFCRSGRWRGSSLSCWRLLVAIAEDVQYAVAREYRGQHHSDDYRQFWHAFCSRHQSYQSRILS